MDRAMRETKITKATANVDWCSKQVAIIWETLCMQIEAATPAGLDKDECVAWQLAHASEICGRLYERVCLTALKNEVQLSQSDVLMAFIAATRIGGKPCETKNEKPK